MVTPMIFSMKSVSSVNEVLAPNNLVDFDLRGYGPAERTTWIQPNTALLVWDPEKRGEITSGRQLFGNYTSRSLTTRPCTSVRRKWRPWNL